MSDPLVVDGMIPFPGFWQASFNRPAVVVPEKGDICPEDETAIRSWFLVRANRLNDQARDVPKGKGSRTRKKDLLQQAARARLAVIHLGRGLNTVSW